MGVDAGDTDVPGFVGAGFGSSGLTGLPDIPSDLSPQSVHVSTGSTGQLENAKGQITTPAQDQSDPFVGAGFSASTPGTSAKKELTLGLGRGVPEEVPPPIPSFIEQAAGDSGLASPIEGTTDVAKSPDVTPVPGVTSDDGTRARRRGAGRISRFSDFSRRSLLTGARGLTTTANVTRKTLLGL